MSMDVRVNTVASRVRVADADALLSPEVLERITRAVMERLEEGERVRSQREAERRVDDRRKGRR